MVNFDSYCFLHYINFIHLINACDLQLGGMDMTKWAKCPCQACEGHGDMSDTLGPYV